jgi:hypothetical protein
MNPAGRMEAGRGKLSLEALRILHKLVLLDNASVRGYKRLGQTYEALSRFDDARAASCDFDNDGKMDLVVLPIVGSPLLPVNRTAGHHSWIGFHFARHDKEPG